MENAPDVVLKHIESDRPFLVDVPVKINIWIREECQRRQFEVIKKARPSILFVTSDGGRNEREWEAIRHNRKIYDEEIDWDCTVYYQYMSENNGLYAMGKKRLALIWSVVDRCIFLEDDIIPSVSFFAYCAELLEKYKDDTRIETICGMNNLGTCEDVTADYFFSRQGSIWGTATWRRVYADRGDFSYGEDPYVMKLLKQRTKRNPTFMKKIEAYAKSKLHEGHVAGGEFWIEFSMYAQNRLQIVPKYNMINNIGFGDASEHAKGQQYFSSDIRKLFNMKTYEYEMPLKHPKYVIPDIEYEKKRNAMLDYNDKRAALRHRIEVTFLRIKHDGFFGWLFGTAKRKLKKKSVRIEK